MSGSFVVSKHIQCSPFGNFTRSLEETQPPIVDDLSFSAVVSFPVPSKAFTKYHQLPVSVVNLQMEYGAHDDTMMIPVIQKPSY